MLDYFAIFTKGGALLWTWQLAALRGNPLDALVRTCLLEERSGEASFSYTPTGASPYTLKWTFHNVSLFLLLLTWKMASIAHALQPLKDVPRCTSLFVQVQQFRFLSTLTGACPYTLKWTFHIVRHLMFFSYKAELCLSTATL
jgi:hypothetical protein